MLITRKRSAQAVGSGVKERNALARGSGTAKYISDSLGQATIEYETQNEGKNSGSGISGGGGSMNVAIGTHQGIPIYTEFSTPVKLLMHGAAPVPPEHSFMIEVPEEQR